MSVQPLRSSAVRSDTVAHVIQNRCTLPLVSSLSTPQKKGSLIWDPRLDALFVSNGIAWIYYPPGSIGIQDLFSVLSVGNFTGGLNIDQTFNSAIISSDGDVILSGTFSTSSGAIEFDPKISGEIFANGNEIITGLLTSEGNIDLISGSYILSSDGNVTLDASGSSGEGEIIFSPKGGSNGLVMIDGDLDVNGTNTIINTQTILIEDNTLYMHNGYITPVPSAGYIVVNYLATNSISSVSLGGFLAGGGGGPTVSTDNTYAFVAGDIIQISSSNNPLNNGIYEVDSNAAGLITIRGVGGVPPTFDMFKKNFVTDPVPVGTITLVNISASSASTGGIWQINTPSSSTIGMIFRDLALELQDSGTGTYSIIFDSSDSTLKMLSSGTDVNIVDSGTGDLTISNSSSHINSSGAGSTSLVFNATTNTLNDLFGGTGITLSSAAGRITITNTSPNITSVGTGTSLVFSSPADTIKSIAQGTDISIVDSGTGTLTINNTASHINSSGAGSTSLVFNSTTNTLNDLFGGTGITLSLAAGRVTINNTSPNITSVGTGTSLVFSSPADTIKSISQGTNITITDNGAGTLTLNYPPSGSSPYQQVGSNITPISASVRTISAGQTNTNNSTNNLIGGGISNTSSGTGSIIGGSLNSVISSTNLIAGGNNNALTLNQSTILNSAIITGNGNRINLSTAAGNVNAGNDVIVGGLTNTISIGGFDTRNAVIGGNNNSCLDASCSMIGTASCACLGSSNFLGGGFNNALTRNQSTIVFSSMMCGSGNRINLSTAAGNVVSAFNNVIGGVSNIVSVSGNNSASSIYGGSSNACSDSTGTIFGGSSNVVISNLNFIAGGNNNALTRNQSTIQMSSIVGGSANRINLITAAGNVITNFSVIIGGASNTISLSGFTSGQYIIGGNNNSVSGQFSLALGVSSSISNTNAFVWSDGSTTSSNANQRFHVGAQGGSRFYSDVARTIGVTLAAGGNSWAAVCDRKLKTNLVELNHDSTLDKISEIEVYNYNIVNTPIEQVCYGTTAQEWHTYFNHIPSEEGEILYSSKDPLKIDQGDMLGILLSCVKGLKSRIESLKQEKDILRQKRCNFETEIEIMKDENSRFLSLLHV